ncbi:non-ribosomal peptide synthetase [Amycolatopsis sp. FBCC-B4732]|uniref:non-ribosomal peptide synthetase n=1 Tax=Amycolatopsis sp. FBCC-B4732 TaxID=3079339 RepID=UPI001FF3C66A|nr:non-ribosomal peptide synthetase [Amycolatopsis sp. FBCC-B4732]UOX89586.1 non-ribosomal peptide synthetase [Amycolatopsis sp. FBCC-B4732]
MTTSFNPAPRPFERAETMHGLFEWCADRWPARTALHHRGRDITYRELAETADAYAAELQARGVGRGSIVPVLLPRSPELFATLLAVLKCGAAYAALDLRWPRTRLAELIEHLGGPVVAAERGAGWSSMWSPPAQPILGARPAAVDVGADDACAVFFTSGTTGTPKGVVTAHRGNVRLFDDWLFTPLDSGAVMPQALAATWDAFGLDSWGVLFNGGTLVLLEDTLELATKLRDLVAIHGVTTIFPPTAVFHSMVDSDLDAFAGLRAVGTGGEKLSARHAARFLEAYPDIPLYNMYGPVESSVAATCHRVRPEDCTPPDSVPLGLPFPNTQAYILDGDRLCDVGESGEICLGGKGLALGYFEDSSLTARKFVELALPSGPERVYRTGDLGRWTAGGLLHFEGRADRQVKIRGHRIELDDVEHNAGRVPGVGACAVVPVTGADGAYEDLCLFYAGSGDAPGEEELRTRLAERLPGYLVPALVQRLERLPVLEDRKLDRRALAELAASRRIASAAPVAESLSDTEAAVAGFLREIIGVPSIASDVSFFRQGGNSLSAAQLCSRISRDLGVKLRISQVFEAPTVRGVAGLITAGKP